MPAIITGNQTGTVGLINKGTAKSTTSGTAIEYTGLPTGLTRITMMLNEVSLATSDYLLIQIGSSSFATSGYSSTSGGMAGAAGFAVTTSTAGYIIGITDTPSSINGSLVITTLGSNIWVASGVCGSIPGAQSVATMNSGKVTLGGTLDRVRITSSSGTANFDGGSINILYE